MSVTLIRVKSRNDLRCFCDSYKSDIIQTLLISPFPFIQTRFLQTTRPSIIVMMEQIIIVLFPDPSLTSRCTTVLRGSLCVKVRAFGKAMICV